MALQAGDEVVIAAPAQKFPNFARGFNGRHAKFVGPLEHQTHHVVVEVDGDAQKRIAIPRTWLRRRTRQPEAA